MQQRWLVILVGVLFFAAGLLMFAMYCKPQRKMRNRRVVLPASK